MLRTTAILVCLCAAALPAFAQAPPNDYCSSATPVFNGVNPGAPTGLDLSQFTNLGAWTEATASCDLSQSVHDVWFSYTATASGVVLVRTSTPPGFTPGSGILTVSVLTTCGGAEIACQTWMSAGAGLGPGWNPAQAAFVATVGHVYIIRVASMNGFGGFGLSNFYLTIVPPGPPPLNDNCVNPLPVPTGSSGPYTNVDATQDATASCSAAQPSIIRDVWFAYFATATGTTTFTAQQVPGGNVAPQISVLTGCGGTELACATGPTVALPVTGGTSYFIRVDSSPNLNGYTTSFNLVVTPAGPPPPNDDCTGALPLVLEVNGPYSNPTATQSAGGYGAFVDVWYSFTTGACPGAYTIDVCGSGSLNAWFDVHATCGGPPIGTSIIDAYSTTCPGPNVDARGTFLAAAFTTYLVRVMTLPGGFGSYNLTITTPTTGAQPFIGFSSPFGPMSIQANLGGLPPGGLYFFPVSLSANLPGSTPYFYGINMTTAQLVAQFNVGFPFTGSADGCGNAQIGPFSGIPTGTIVYTVALGFAAGYVLPPTNNSWATTYTVP